MTDNAVRSAARPARRRRSGVGRRPFWLLTPGGILMLAVILLPLVLGICMSLLDLDQYTLRSWLEAPFTGFQNYAEALADTPLATSLLITVGYSVIATLLSVPLGVAAAVATQDAFRGRAFFRSLFLVPYVIPAFVVGTIWRTILQPDGIVNGLLGAVGVEAPLWLNGPMSFWTLVGVQIWMNWPFIYLLTLAGLQTVDGEVHEAAALDGTSWVQKLRYIVLPYITGPLALGILISLLHAINNFTLPFVMFGLPAPGPVNVLSVLTYATGFQTFRFGLSAAMAALSLVLTLIPLLIYLRAVRLDVGEKVSR